MLMYTTLLMCTLLCWNGWLYNWTCTPIFHSKWSYHCFLAPSISVIYYILICGCHHGWHIQMTLSSMDGILHPRITSRDDTFIHGWDFSILGWFWWMKILSMDFLLSHFWVKIEKKYMTQRHLKQNSYLKTWCI